MTIPLPNPLTTTETVLVGLLLLFFALWGWRHGLDAAILWGLFVFLAAWLAPTLAPFLGKIINALLGMVLLITQGQFSMDNWSALMNAQYAAIAAPIDVQDPNSSSMPAADSGALRHDLVHRVPHGVEESGQQGSHHFVALWGVGRDGRGVCHHSLCAGSDFFLSSHAICGNCAK